MTKVQARQDDSGHWYVIPDDLDDKWTELNDIMDDGEEGQIAFEEAESEFILTFSKYMTGSDLNNVQLYADIE